MHTSGRRSPRRDRQEARRTGPGTRRFEFLGELYKQSTSRHIGRPPKIVSAPSEGSQPQGRNVVGLCGRPTVVGGDEVCASAICETIIGYSVATARDVAISRIHPSFSVSSSFSHLGFVLLVISVWQTFQILKYKKVRFRIMCRKRQLCDPNPAPIAYLDVRSDKTDTNWLLLDYEAWISFSRKVLPGAHLALWPPERSL